MTGKSSALPNVVLGTAMCFLMAILEGYDIQAFGIAGPKLIVALGLDPSQQGAAASIAMVGLVMGAFFGGRISDNVGRKPVLLVSAAVFGFCSILTGLSTNFATLLLARLITGLGFGGAFPVLIAIAAEISSPARRSVTTGILFSGMPTGGALVSLFARLGGEQMDWRVIFFVGGAIPLIVLPLLWKFLPETRPARDAKAEVKLLPALFREGRAFATVSLTIACFLAVVVIYLFLNWLPTLVVAKGYLPGDGAAAAFAFNTAAVFGAVLLGMAVDLLGVRVTMATSYLALLAAIVLLGLASALPALVLFSAFVGLFSVGISFVLYGIIPPYYPSSLRAAACGAIVGIGRLGTIAGPLLAGQLRQQGWTAEHVIDALLPAVLIGAVAVFLLTLRSRSQITVARA